MHMFEHMFEHMLKDMLMLYLQQMADKIGDFMATDGVKFLKKCVPTKVC